jgi:uncharacterized membrane protein
MIPPKIRQTAYLLGTIATSAVTMLALWRGIDTNTATALGNAITGLLGLLGVGASATAGVVLSRQRKEGVLDAQSPVDQAISAINATVAQVQSASADLDRVKTAVSDVFGSLPVVGPLAQQVIKSVDMR